MALIIKFFWIQMIAINDCEIEEKSLTPLRGDKKDKYYVCFILLYKFLFSPISKMEAYNS